MGNGWEEEDRNAAADTASGDATMALQPHKKRKDAKQAIYAEKEEGKRKHKGDHGKKKQNRAIFRPRDEDTNMASGTMDEWERNRSCFAFNGFFLL